jgi:hypothetical protein
MNIPTRLASAVAKKAVKMPSRPTARPAPMRTPGKPTRPAIKGPPKVM